MIFDFCQCHVGCRQCISKSRWSNAYPDPAPKKWVDPDPEKHVGSMPLVWQDSGMAKWVVAPTYLTLVRASTQLPIVFRHPWLLFISYACSTLNILCLLWYVNSTVRSVQCWLLFCVRMMSPVPCALSAMMLCLLKLMKYRVIWSLLLYWRHSTWLSKLFLQEIFGVVFANFWWTNRVLQWQIDDFDDFDAKSANCQKQSHMKPVVVRETLALAQWIISVGHF